MKTDSPENIQTHTLAVLVENEFGVLARVAGMFAARGFNIDALSVAPTEDSKLSRITLITRSSSRVIEQMVRQLNRLVDVIQVLDLSEQKALRRELMLVKLRLKAEQATGTFIQQLLPPQMRLLETEGSVVVAEWVGEHDENEQVLQKLKASVEILEVLRTGNIAMQRGAHTLTEGASSD